MREKILWLRIIEDNNLVEEFRKYFRQHDQISTNRAARAFVLKNNIPFNKKDYEITGVYNKGRSIAVNNKIIDIAYELRALNLLGDPEADNLEE